MDGWMDGCDSVWLPYVCWDRLQCHWRNKLLSNKLFGINKNKPYLDLSTWHWMKIFQTKLTTLCQTLVHRCKSQG